MAESCEKVLKTSRESNEKTIWGANYPVMLGLQFSTTTLSKCYF